MTPLRFILVGLGARSRIWQRVLTEHPDCGLVGLVETNPNRLAEALAETVGTVGGTSLDEVAACVEADVALLCTPPGGRQSQVAAACAAACVARVAARGARIAARGARIAAAALFLLPKRFHLRG